MLGLKLLVTTSKAPVTTSVALVSNSFFMAGKFLDAFLFLGSSSNRRGKRTSGWSAKET